MLDDKVNPPSRRSGRSRWALRGSVGAILAVVVLLVLLGGLMAWQPAALLRAGLWAAGQDKVAFDELRVGLNEIELTGLAIGGPADHQLGRLRIHYRPRDLLRGRIEQLSVEGVTLRGRIDQDGLRLEGLDTIAATADEPTQTPALPMPDRVSVRDVRLELATPLGVLIVPFEAELHPEQDRAAFVLDATRAELAAPTGQLRADLHIEGAMPLDPQALAGEVTASGRLQLRVEALGVPGVATGIDGTGELAFVFERGQLDATLSGARLQLEAIAPERDAVATLLPAPWQVDFVQPAAISASFRDEEILLQGSGEIALATAGPQLEAALSTTVALDSDRRVRELVLPDVEIELHDVRWADMRLERASIRGEGAGSPEAWEGTLDLDLAGAGAHWPDLMLEGGTARAGLDVRFADGRLSVMARDPSTLQLAALSWADDVRVDGLEVRVPPSSTPLLSAGVADGSIEWQQHLSASLPAFEVVVTAGEGPQRLAAEVNELQVELSGDQDELDGGRVVLSGGAVGAPAYDLRLAGIAVEAHLSAAGLDREQPVAVSVASIVHEGMPPWFAPLRLQGSLQPRDDRIAFDAKLADRTGAVEMRVHGQHDLASAQGSAQVDLPPMTLAPGQLQPKQLSPWLGDIMQDVSGRLALDGTLGWGAGDEVQADLDLLVDGLAFTSGPARFEQVNGVIALDQLAPPSTPPGQELAVGLVDIGLPLTNGLLTFDLEPGQLLIEQLRWQFVEGRIRAAPFTIGSEGMAFSTTLRAERLKLDEIFALAQLDGLTGQGTMHGTLPITVAGTEAVVEGGELVSDGPGWVRYRPDQAPAALQAGGENVNLLLQALENFRYEELRLTIDGRTDGEMDVGLHIAGANPDLYDGYPIEFNLNLEGALAEILRASLAGYQIPELIRERMQSFGR